jgi:hypothetical protein
METTERIVEAYVRYVKGCATIANIHCAGQHEIDLLAIDPRPHGKRYHVEVGVSISGAYSKLTSKQFSVQALRTRVKQAGQRRTVGYFVHQKFAPRDVKDSLEKYGFRRGRYERVIVSWGWTDGAFKQAKRMGITLWDFRVLIQELAAEVQGGRSYFSDDTLRTLHLFTHARDYQPKTEG